MASTSDRREHVLQIRLSDEERNILKFVADAQHLDLSTYVRAAALQAADETISKAGERAIAKLPRKTVASLAKPTRKVRK
jgi:uncharacterized protein (DUF1778 family)